MLLPTPLHSSSLEPIFANIRCLVFLESCALLTPFAFVYSDRSSLRYVAIKVTILLYTARTAL